MSSSLASGRLATSNLRVHIVYFSFIKKNYTEFAFPTFYIFYLISYLKYGNMIYLDKTLCE